MTAVAWFQNVTSMGRNQQKKLYNIKHKVTWPIEKAITLYTFKLCSIYVTGVWEHDCFPNIISGKSQNNSKRWLISCSSEFSFRLFHYLEAIKAGRQPWPWLALSGPRLSAQENLEIAGESPWQYQLQPFYYRPTSVLRLFVMNCSEYTLQSKFVINLFFCYLKEKMYLKKLRKDTKFLLQTFELFYGDSETTNDCKTPHCMGCLWNRLRYLRAMVKHIISYTVTPCKNTDLSTTKARGTFQ